MATYQILDANSAGKHAANLAFEDNAKTVPNTIGFQPVCFQERKGGTCVDLRSDVMRRLTGSNPGGKYMECSVVLEAEHVFAKCNRY